jgi:hypothetical protein
MSIKNTILNSNELYTKQFIGTRNKGTKTGTSMSVPQIFCSDKTFVMTKIGYIGKTG